MLINYDCNLILQNVMFQPIHIVRLDERSLNIYIYIGWTR
ncbi:DUF6888 family protein [Nostoc sp. UHCC 0252]